MQEVAGRSAVLLAGRLSNRQIGEKQMCLGGAGTQGRGSEVVKTKEAGESCEKFES